MNETREQKLRRCRGCRDNFYNGNNDLGVKECWYLENMDVTTKVEVPIDQRPPYSQPTGYFPTCYRRPGYAYLDPKTVMRPKKEGGTT